MDKRQKVKQYLKKYLELDAERQQLIEQINECKAEYDGIKAQVLTGMPSGSGNASSVQERALMRLATIEYRWAVKVDEMGKQGDDIEHLIQSIDNTYYRMLLRYRYIDGMRWEDIASKMHYTWRYMHMLHRSALDYIANSSLFFSIEM